MTGFYLGVPVRILADLDDGWIWTLWPDKESPRKGQDYTYDNPQKIGSNVWKMWRDQVRT